MPYSMKQTCQKVGMTYEALKFYCNQGLVPNVKRDKNNYRVFDERDIAWIKGLICLKRCGMSIEDMKQYLALCLGGKATIPERKEILKKQKDLLVRQMERLRQDIAYLLTFEHLVDTGAGSGLVFRPLFPPLETPMYLIWKKRQVLTPIAERFIREVQALFEKGEPGPSPEDGPVV